MEYALFIAIVGFIFAVQLLAFAGIFRKAGYSPWLTLLMLVPLVNLIWLLTFAFASEWPIHRQLARARAGSDAAAAEDEELALNQAVRVEHGGDWDQAIAMYEHLARQFADRPTGRYAAEAIERLRQRQLVAGQGISSSSG